MKKITRSFVVAGLLALATSVNAQEHVWKYVATGDASTYAIRDDGTLWSCGWNEKGQLGAPAVSERTAEWQCVGTDTWQGLRLLHKGRRLSMGSRYIRERCAGNR